MAKSSQIKVTFYCSGQSLRKMQRNAHKNFMSLGEFIVFVTTKKENEALS